MLDLQSHMNDKDKQQVAMISAPVCGNVDYKNNHGWGFPSDHSCGSKLTMFSHSSFGC